MKSLATTFRVIRALMKREALTRYGRMRFGYLWAVAEPAIYVLAFIAYREFVGAHVPFGESGIVFLLTAVLTFRTAMSLTRRTLGAIHSNIALLTYPQVRTFDVIMARIILEVLTWSGTTVAFLLGLYLYAGVWVVERPDIFIAGYLATLYLGASLGFFNATFVCLFPIWDRIVALIAVPMIFLSGVFFLPESMPPEIRRLIYVNPILHVVEWVRSGVYFDYNPFVDKVYVLGFSSVALLLGLLINRFYQAKMLED